MVDCMTKLKSFRKLQLNSTNECDYISTYGDDKYFMCVYVCAV